MVRKITVLLVVSVVIGACAKMPAVTENKHNFEGVVEYNVTYHDTIDAKEEGLPEKVFATIRKDKMMMAFQLGDKKFKVVTDLKTKTISSIFYHQKRFYATISDSTSRVYRNIQRLNITKTEKLKKIAGHRCIKNTATTNFNGEQVEFDYYYSPALAHEPYYWSYGFKNTEGILLKFTIFDFGLPAELEAVSVTTKNIDPYIFSLPPGTIVTH